MTERERLIELLKSDSCESPMLCDPNCKYANLERCYEERTADYLLENGVTVLPAKVGDTVYIKNEPYDILAMYIEENEISYIANYDCDERNCLECPYAKEILFGEVTMCEKSEYSEFTASDIGKTVFRTLEEAEKALKEREENA